MAKMPQRTQEVLLCGRCKLPIVDIAYIQVRAAIILQEFLPGEVPLYKSKEHAENYAQHIPMHADCWIATLKDHSAILHDLKGVLEIMKKEKKDKKEKKK